MPIAPLHSLGQDNQNEVQHDIFGHVMPLALVLASCDANGIVNSTSAFLRARQLKLDSYPPWEKVFHM